MMPHVTRVTLVRYRSLLGAALLIAGIIAATAAAACGGGAGAQDEAGPILTLKIDLPESGSAFLPLTVAGWGGDLGAATGPGIERVDVLDGGCNGEFLGSAAYGIARPDVAEQHGEQFRASGWQLFIDSLSAGEHRLAVLLRSSLGTASACEIVTVSVPPRPLLSIEDLEDTSVLLPFRIGGWAVDLGADSGTGVERVEILDGGCEGTFLGEAEYGIVRGDVAERYGHQFGESGWQLVLDKLSGGDHVIAVVLYSSVGDTSACRTVSVSVL